jgi:TRAP-type C4-dicarboxylate transport system permease small subunit
MKKRIDSYLGYVLIFLFAAMAVDVLWGVVTRYLMKSQADWTEELARYLLIWLSILGAAYASGQRMHLAIDLLMPKLNINGRRKLFILINAIILVFAVTVMIVGGLRLMYITAVLGQDSAALRIPMALVYSVLPLSGILVAYFKAHDIRNVVEILNLKTRS